MYVSRGIQCVEATIAGVPSLRSRSGRRAPGTGRGGGGRALHAQCADRLGMIAGVRKEADVVHVMRDFLGLRATKGGLLYTHSKLGQVVEKDTVVAHTENVYGDIVERFVAPERAVLVRTTTLSTVSTGERAVTLGLL